MPKAKPASRGAKARHDPLEKAIHEDARRHIVQQKVRRARQGGRGDAGRSDMEGGAVPAKLSRKILALAKEQSEEIEGTSAASSRGAAPSPNKSRAYRGGDSESDDDDDDDDFGDGSMVVRQGDFVEAADISVADEAALAQFMPRQSNQRRTLGDIIADKIREREAAAAGAAAQGGSQQPAPGNGATIVYSEEVSEKVVEVYSRVGELLTRYRAGKVPKAFKIIPSLRNWEEVLLLTNPEKWSSQAMYVATKIFASNLNPKNAQRFYNLILLPAVRDDIRSNRRLNYHLYRSLKKALYKPAGFFKGILLPLCARSEACTLREAVIIGSVMSKVSIPMMHSAAALLKMASMPYSGVTSLFMKVLIDKKYAMPYRVIDALVAHFMKFMSDTRSMPVIWHQCLLVFSERYHKDVTEQQKQSLKMLLRNHSHRLITPLIRRELFSGRSRGQKASEQEDVEMTGN